MIGLQDLSVGQVSGMIAAAVFFLQIVIPIALPIILLGALRLRSSNVTATAVSWSVIGRSLHSSLWPHFLQTDSVATLSTSKSIASISFFGALTTALIAVTAIVTPLGLYESIASRDDPKSEPFHYVQDISPMGLGTPPRTNMTWSRICGGFFPVACPNTQSDITQFTNASGTYVHADWYDSHIPSHVVEVFQSGLSMFSGSVSSFFDIQYRSSTKAKKPRIPDYVIIDNGTAQSIGSYRPLSSLLLSDAIQPVEGLVVDMKNGGIGFRNHSAPAWRPYGSTWTEDLLFVEPETVCVDTNLTLDFIVSTTEESMMDLSGISNLVLTDRGGFVNINHTYPRWEKENVQERPDLWQRAYKAAWLNNAITMAYMNVTNPSNETTGVKAFQYLNSSIGRRFRLHKEDGTTATNLVIEPSTLKASSAYGEYLQGTEGLSNYSATSNTTYDFPSEPPLYPNPYNMDISQGFFDALTLCSGSGGRDYANYTNTVALCGTLYGAPRREDGSLSLLFDPGSSWTLPMYSCISTAKASIKTVSFRFNGSDDVSGLSVTNVQDKTYPDEASKPLWGVEHYDLNLTDVVPLWGLVTPESAATLNLSTLRKESLYLPGYGSALGGGMLTQNLPGQDFASQALSKVFSIPAISATGDIDYSGSSNLAMYRLWQDLSRNATSAGRILSLIWTDIAANMVLGTRGLHPADDTPLRKRDASPAAGTDTPTITTYERRVRYRYAYGIPAFLTLLVTASILLTTSGLMLFGSAGPSHMRLFLDHTSAGRFLTAQQAGYGQAIPVETKAWVSSVGRQRFTLGSHGWVDGGLMAGNREAGDGQVGIPAPYVRVSGYGVAGKSD